MLITQIECKRIVPQSGFSYCNTERHLLLLGRNAMRYCYQGDFFEKPAFQMLYCLPGQALRVEPPGEYALVDYVEFRLNNEEKALFDALPLPVGLCTPTNFSVLAAILKNIQYLVYSADRYRLEKGDLFLRQLLYSTASGDEQEPENASREGMLFYRMRQLQKAVSDNPLCYQSVKEAADYVGLSESWFLHLYKHYFGISYAQNLIRCKMDHGKTLLRSTDWTVERIAKELGYTDDTYFYRQFKQQTGLSPAAYRRIKSSIV